MKKILIADDHPIVVQGLKFIITDENPDIIVDSVETCRSLLDLLNNNLYDILLLDVSLPDMIGLDALVEIKRKYPKLPVLILSLYPEDQYAIVSMKLGLQNKQSWLSMLLKTISPINILSVALFC